MRVRLLLGLAAVIVLVGACTTPGPGTVIDGWELGDQTILEPDPRCDRRAEYLDAAVAALAERDPDHPPIVETWLFNQTHQEIRSGGPIYVALFRLADGSLLAIGVGRIGIGGVVPFDAPGRPWYPGGTEPADGPCGPQLVHGRP